jgi:hypothetical protein
MNSITITIDLHPSGNGFQVYANDCTRTIGYPNPVEDITEALSMAFSLRAIVEHELNITIPDKNVRVTQQAIEHNAMTTPANMEAYSIIQTGKVKAQN